MQLTFDSDVEEFRAEFAAFLDANPLDPALTRERPQSSSDIPQWARRSQRLLFDNGWLLPGNPPEFGGRNATLLQQYMYLEELSRRRIYQSFNPQGVGIIAASLLSFGRFTLGIGPSHHWIVNGQLGLAYERPVSLIGDYLDVLSASFAGPGTVDVDNDSHRVHSPVDVTDTHRVPILLSALGPTMLRLAGQRAAGTVLWMADERAIRDHVVPRITEAATRAGRSAPRIVAGVPVALCADDEADDARGYASEVLGHADFSPNYVRLLQHGDARDVGDTMAAGDESAILTRLRRYRDAGATDLAARIVPLGKDATQRTASRRRTQEFLSSLCPAL